MAHAPGETVRGRLAGLDAATLTAFVAAVYAARGWTVERDSDGAADLLATPPDDDRPRRLTVRGGNVAVSIRYAGEVTTLDAADLGRMAWYAVDADTRERLCREFFDADPSEFAAPAATDDGAGDDRRDGPTRTDTPPSDQRDGPTGPDTAPDDRRDGSTRADAPSGDQRDGPTGADASPDEGSDTIPTRRAFAAGLVLVLVVAGVAAAGPALTSSGTDEREVEGPTATNSTASDYSAAEAATARLDTGWNATADEEEAPPPGMIAVPTIPEPRPPGVSATGVTNASALIDGHVATLDGRSYRLTVHHREFVDGAPTGFVRERTVVENATRYRTDLRWVGTVRQDPRAVGNTSAFADGRSRYVRLAGEAGATVETELRPEDRFASRSERYLRAVLAGSDTKVVGAFERDGTPRFWITVSRDEGPGPETTGSLLVDERGLVHELHHEYVYRPSDGPPVRVVVTMRFTPGTVSASPPPWVDDVR